MARGPRVTMAVLAYPDEIMPALEALASAAKAPELAGLNFEVQLEGNWKSPEELRERVIQAATLARRANTT